MIKELKNKSKDEIVQEHILALARIEQLEHQLDLIRKSHWGRRSEKLPPIDENQLSLFEEEIKELKEQQQEYIKVEEHRRKVRTAKRKKHLGRKPLPAHLERVEEIIEPEEDVSGLKLISTVETQILEYVPARLFVRVILRPQYAKPNGEGVIVAPLPTRAIDKGIPGESLLTHILISKFVDHLPLFRQLKIFKRENIEIAESTLDGWLRACCELLEPLYEVHKKEVLAQNYLQVDETPIPVLDQSKKEKTHRGYHWVYYSPQKRLALFDYQPGRGIEAPRDCLGDFQGYMQTDGYSAYSQYGKKSEIEHIECMAHARRKFIEARKNDSKRARHALEQIQKLYLIEKQAREENLHEEERLALRQEKAVPILKNLKEWFLEQAPQVTPKSAIGIAIKYALARWDRLCAYTCNGMLEIDNNLVENQIRPVALGRKNYLFAGSHKGAARAAMLYSFFGTCKQHKINPRVWLEDVLKNIKDYKTSELHELLPQNWVEE